MADQQNNISGVHNYPLKFETNLHSERQYTENPLYFSKPILSRQEKPRDEEGQSPAVRQYQKKQNNASFTAIKFDSLGQLGQRKNVNKPKTRIFVNQEVQAEKRENFKNLWLQRMINRDQSKTFIQRLLRAANFLRLEYLNKSQQNIILQLTNSNLQDVRIKREIINLVPLIDSQGYMSYICDLLFICLGLFSIIWYPFTLSFQGKDDYTQTDVFLFVCFFLHILFQFNRSKILKGTEVYDRSQIANLYMRGSLSSDLTAVVLILFRALIQLSSFQTFLVTLYVFIRVIRIVSAVDEILEQNVNKFSNLNLKLYIRDIFSLVAVILQLFTIVHLMACIWHGVGENSYGENWIETYGFENKPTIDRYLVSFYWAAMTMTTVGYGDITPKNRLEYFCANVTMLVACVVFGYSMNKIGILLSHINQRNADLKKNLTLLNTYMNKNGVEKQLQGRVRNYLEYLAKVENEQHELQAEGLIEKLPQSIRQELKYQIKGKMIQECTALERFSDLLKNKMCSLVDEVCFQPDETICDNKVKDDHSLFLLRNGQAFIDNTQNKALKYFNIENSQSFGELSFFTAQPRVAKIISSEFSRLLKIPREPFLSLLAEHPKDKELFFYLKDCITFNSQYLKIKLQCFFCQNQSHLMSDCPYLRINADPERIIKSSLYSCVQPRMSYQRNRDKMFRSMIYRQNCQKITQIKSLESRQLQSEFEQVESQIQMNETLGSPTQKENSERYQRSHKSSSRERETSRKKNRKVTVKKQFSLNHEQDLKPPDESEISDREEQNPFFHSISLRSQSALNDKKSPKIIGRAIFSNTVRSTYNAKSPSTQEQVQNSMNYTDLLGFEKLCNFQNYFPSWNHDTVIKRLKERQNRTIPTSPYTFYQSIISKVKRVKKHAQKLQQNNRYHRMRRQDKPQSPAYPQSPFSEDQTQQNGF